MTDEAVLAAVAEGTSGTGGAGVTAAADWPWGWRTTGEP